MGAMIIATCIIVAWTRTIYGEWSHVIVQECKLNKSGDPGQFKLLAGIAAPVEFQQLVVYKVCRPRPSNYVVMSPQTCRRRDAATGYDIQPRHQGDRHVQGLPFRSRVL